MAPSTRDKLPEAGLDTVLQETPHNDGTGETQYLSGTKLYTVFAGIFIAVFLMALDASVISTAIPTISSDFHATVDIGWYAAAYPLATCALQPLAGKLVVLFPLRWTFQVFFLVFLLGSLLCGAATTSNMFIVGRAVAGSGGAGVSSGGLAVIATVTSPDRRPLFMGMITSLFAVGTIAGPLIGGALTQNATWRWCFYINLPAGAVTVVALLLFFKPQKKKTVESEPLTLGQKLLELNLTGCIIFISGIVMILLALDWGGSTYTWVSGEVLGPLIAGVFVVLVVFPLHEILFAKSPVIPSSIIRSRSVLLSIAFSFLFFGSYITTSYYLPEFFQVVRGKNAVQSGVLTIPLVVCQVVGSVTSGVLANRLGYLNPWLFLGCILQSIGSGLFTTLNLTTSHGRWAGYQVIQGLGIGVAAQIPLLVVQTALKSTPEKVPLAISLTLFAQYFGGSVTQSINASIFTNQLKKKLVRDVGLDEGQIAALLHAGNARVRETVRDHFPDRLDGVLEAYNSGITTVFWLPVAGVALAFVLSQGIEWISVRKESDKPAAATPQEDSA